MKVNVLVMNGRVMGNLRYPLHLMLEAFPIYKFNGGPKEMLYTMSQGVCVHKNVVELVILTSSRAMYVIELVITRFLFPTLLHLVVY